ncbi:hypothetical protein EDB85DRAFT_245478 [Lactarius pseudohatsudake]|nr:hypothetical protein EDB85DRAFT_245478 [Lactarius pseudohatsudake]
MDDAARLPLLLSLLSPSPGLLTPARVASRKCPSIHWLLCAAPCGDAGSHVTTNLVQFPSRTSPRERRKWSVASTWATSKSWYDGTATISTLSGGQMSRVVFALSLRYPHFPNT